MTEKRKLPTQEPASEDFRRWFETIGMPALLTAARVFIEAVGQEHPPQLVIFGHGPRQVCAIPLTLATPQDKDRIAFMHRAAAAMTEINRAVVFVTETWTTSLAPEEYEEAKKKYKQVADMPGRTEALMLNAMSGGMQLVAKWDIKPGPPRKIDLDSYALTDPAAGTMDGRMIIPRDKSKDN